MDNENITQTALKKSVDYIGARIAGSNKQEAREIAGYSRNSLTMPETTKAYAHALNKILTANRDSMDYLMDDIRESILNGDTDKLSVKDKAILGKTLADIHKILTPQVTIKEEQMKDGTTKRTTWGQGSVQGNTIEE